jgi:ferric-chelate reductase
MLLVGWLAVGLAAQRAGATSLPKDERCVTAIYSAYNYISFAGVPIKGMLDTRCQNQLKVTSIYAASQIYCSDRECAAGLAQLVVECRKFGNQKLLPRDKVAENLTEDAIQTMRKVGYLELPRAEPIDTPVLLSASYFNRMFNTIVSAVQ